MFPRSFLPKLPQMFHWQLIISLGTVSYFFTKIFFKSKVTSLIHSEKTYPKPFSLFQNIHFTKSYTKKTSCWNRLEKWEKLAPRENEWEERILIGTCPAFTGAPDVLRGAVPALALTVREVEGSIPRSPFAIFICDLSSFLFFASHTLETWAVIFFLFEY